MSLNIRSQGPEPAQNRFRNSVSTVINAARRTRAGSIVISTIEASPMRVFIEPYTDPDRNAEAVPMSELASGSFSRNRIAHGTHSIVRFSPTRSVMPRNWPQGAADEVMVHELAHALRQITGTERYARDAAGRKILLQIASFGNVEEFFAAMVASVHSSELSRPPLANHGQWPLRNPGVLQKAPYSTRLREFWQRMPQFCTRMAAIPESTATFNPFRDVPH